MLQYSNISFKKATHGKRFVETMWKPFLFLQRVKCRLWRRRANTYYREGTNLSYIFEGMAHLFLQMSGDLETQGVPIEPRWHSPAIQKCTCPPESASGKPSTPPSGPQSNTIMTSKSARKLQFAQKFGRELLSNPISTASGPWGELPHRSPPHSICCCKSHSIWWGN